MRSLLFSLNWAAEVFTIPLYDVSFQVVDIDCT